MLDLKFIRENKERVKKACLAKNRPVDIDKLLTLDEEKRKLIKKVEELRRERNKISKQLTNNIKQKGKEIKEKIKIIEEKLTDTDNLLKDFLLGIPNVYAKDVPIGRDASSNEVIKTWGEVPKFDFKPLSHIELGKNLDLIDFERGVKLGGSRMYFLKNEAAEMELSLMWYALKKLVQKGFTPLIPPVLIKKFAFEGIGQFPWGKPEIYYLLADDLYLSGTAEVPVTAYYSNEILKEEELPKKFVAFSLCFRREAGSYGKDTKGLYRLHQFNKVEQVVLCKADLKEGLNWLEILLKNSQELLDELKLPYRVVKLSTGEMGEPQYKKYDIETWMPSRNSYGETQSDSFMTDFQSRRLNIKYKTKNGEIKYCYTLNNTVIASPRILIAILENYQQKDGTVLIPEVLQPFLNKAKITPK